MGGHQVPEQGPRDDGYDEDGYDESQRAEVLEATRGGPNDGAVQTDLDPDLGEEIDQSEEEAMGGEDAELGEEDPDARIDRSDRDEDEIQADFDNDSVSAEELDAELKPAQESALDR
jgi:DNA-directed RNA polymerase subunit delta